MLLKMIPDVSGVYMVLRISDVHPEFLVLGRGSILAVGVIFAFCFRVFWYAVCQN